MKRLNQIVVASIFALVFFSCEEVGPFIDFTHDQPIKTGIDVSDVVLVDTTFVDANLQTADDKNVLIEEFTGVRCPNCPDGSILAENLAAQSNGRLQIISIHSGFFATPYPGEPDLEIQQGTNIESLLGGAVNYPSASINRFDAGIGFISSSTTWEADINNEYNKTSPVNIIISNNFDEETREGVVKISTHFIGQFSDNYKLSIMLLESNIIQTQDVNGDVTPDYNHKHVLRDMLTPFDGELWTNAPQAGFTRIKDFKYGPLPADFEISSLEIVAFVTNADNLYVEQVEHLKF